MWRRLFDPEPYRSEAVRQSAGRLRGMMEAVVAGDGCDWDSEPPDAGDGKRCDSLFAGGGSGAEDRKPSHRERTRKANAIRALYSSTELRQSWEILTTFVRAARHGAVNDDDIVDKSSGSVLRFRLVHAAAALGCPPLLLRFSAALNPDQVRTPELPNGRLPLHLTAVAASTGAAGADVGSRDGEETAVSTVARLYPEAAEMQDSEGRLPLSLAIESGKPWEVIKTLLLCCPRALTTRDTKMRMLPFMISAVGADADLDVIYRLLRENPLEVSRGIC
uniref:Ankyrin repeat protein n=1 Tax=Odontella aurita TaxID=265563 RepID=A0A7S4NE40_9STRA